MKKIFIFVVLIFVIISTLSYSALADKFKDLSPQQIDSKMKELMVVGKTYENEMILREYIDFLSNYEISDKYIEKDVFDSSKFQGENAAFKKVFPKTYITFNALGYMLDYSEGELYRDIDYNKLIKKYDIYISKLFLDYLVIMASDKMQDDAGIIVEYDYIFKTIAKCDLFLEKAESKYGDEINEIEQFRKFMIIMYFVGLDNTPVFEWNVNKITDEKIIKSYKNSIKEYGTTKTGKILKEYYTILKKSRFCQTKEVKEFLTKNKIGFQFEESE